MSTFDKNTEHEDRPEFDDNGEPIIYIDEDIIPDEFASEYDGVIDLDVQDDSFYETVWGGDASSVATLAAGDSTTGEEVTDPLEVEVEQDASDTRENDGILEQANEDYNNAVDILINVLTQALAQGEITEEMNASILDAQGTKTKNEQIIKEICNVQEDNSILKQLADIKANMVAASVDDIIDILTEGGTKPWLYKDSNNNVLVDSQSIPELTVLVNKLNLIATGGDEASEIQLTPEFIKLVCNNDTFNSTLQIKADEISSTLSGIFVTKSEVEKTLKSVTNEYYISTSNTELIDGSWSTTVPTPQANKYIWRRERSEFVDGSITYGDPICLDSNDGYTILLTKDTITCVWDSSGDLGGGGDSGGNNPSGGNSPALTISNISSKSIIEGAAFGINYTTNKAVSKHYISWNASSSNPTYTNITSYVSSSSNSHQYLENDNTQAIGTYNVAIKVVTANGESKVSNVFTITITKAESGGNPGGDTSDTNLLNGKTLVNAYFNNNTGEVVTSGAAATTGSLEDYIPVTAGATYTFNCNMNGATISHFRYGWYDSSKTFMTCTTLYNTPPFDITIADGASYIRFHIVTDADHTYSSITDMSLTRKNSSSGGSSGGETGSDLTGTYLFFGDSICYGGGTGGYGYPQAIKAKQPSMTSLNYSKSGTCIARNDSYDVKYPSILSKIQDTSIAADYVILEGGVNDSWGNRNPIGTFKGGTAPTTSSAMISYGNSLNEYQFADALEKCIIEIKLKWWGKKVFYVIPHPINQSYSNPYFNLAIQICNKWGVKVIDLRNSGCTSADTTDGTHPTRAAYDNYYAPNIINVLKANK